MFWFKRCPRCSGDLYVERDQYGTFVTCMQCGFSRDVVGKPQDPLELSSEPVPAPVTPSPSEGKRRRLSHGGRHFAKSMARERRSNKYVA